MARVLLQAPGQTTLGLGAAGKDAQEQVQAYLERYLAGPQFRSLTVYLNIPTGAPYSGNLSIPTIASLIRHGAVWVDYGQWPFGQARASVGGTSSGLFSLHAGFSQFVAAAGVPLGEASGFANTEAIGKAIANLPVGLIPFAATFQHTGDAFDFDLSDWTWRVILPYPYSHGLPTTTKADGILVAMPGAPAASTTTTLASGYVQTVYVYSAFGLRIGRGWYFEAQPEIPPEQYARFIAETLGARVSAPAAVTTTRATPTGGVRQASAVTRAAAIRVQVPGPGSLPVLRYGDTGPAVRLAQERLIDHGFGVGPTGADGKFGSHTLAAVRAFQAHERISVDGVIGTQTWGRLLSLSGAAAPAAQSLAQELAAYREEVRRMAVSSVPTGGGGAPAVVKRHNAVASRPSPTGIWVNGHGYAVVAGRRVPVPNAPVQGGVVNVNGYKVHFPPRPTRASTQPYYQSEIKKLLGEEAKALGITPQTAEWLDIAAGVGLAILLVTQAQS
jgi:peptidoglycan hydrolase-like protein with peptidoglycan-binding domain